MSSTVDLHQEHEGEPHTGHRRRRLAMRVAHARAGTRLVSSMVVGITSGLLLPSSLSVQVRLVASWDGFALTALALTWFTILTLRPTHIRRVARLEDPSRTASLALVLLGAGASLLSVLVLLHASMTMSRDSRIAAIMLALSAVVLAWVLIHTVFTLRYAHDYFGSNPEGGLAFPGKEECPEYIDFAYFAFVVGMTAQTSDVGVETRLLRRTVLIHGVVSFAFNTAVVALSIGVLTSLLASATAP